MMEELKDKSVEGVKLFVGQIPKDISEDELKEYFEEFGHISEISIIRDNANMNHKGCAFVTFLFPQSAQKAVEKLHDQVKLPGSNNALQVRIAETQVERENKLFIGMLPKTVNEQDLINMFVTYGQLREVHIIRGPEGSPKGCAFVKFVNRDSAIAAIAEMHDTIPTGATRPLVVKFAESKKQTRSKGSEMDGMLQNIGQEGWYGSPPPQQSSRNQFSFPTQSMNGPNPVQWYTQSQPTMGGGNIPNQRYQFSPNQNYFNNVGSMNYSEYQPEVEQRRMGSASGSNNAYFPQTFEKGTPKVQNILPQSAESPYVISEVGGDGAHSRPPEGPSGANLFIYHLPRDLTDADLATLFAPFGNVISAKVFVDKKTSDSKGFGFVSYDTLQSAESAIEAMNGFQIGSKRLKVQPKRVGSGSIKGDDSFFGNNNIMMNNPSNNGMPPSHGRIPNNNQIVPMMGNAQRPMMIMLDNPHNNNGGMMMGNGLNHATSPSSQSANLNMSGMVGLGNINLNNLGLNSNLHIGNNNTSMNAASYTNMLNSRMAQMSLGKGGLGIDFNMNNGRNVQQIQQQPMHLMNPTMYHHEMSGMQPLNNQIMLQNNGNLISNNSNQSNNTGEFVSYNQNQSFNPIR